MGDTLGHNSRSRILKSGGGGGGGGGVNQNVTLLSLNGSVHMSNNI